MVWLYCPGLCGTGFPSLQFQADMQLRVITFLSQGCSLWGVCNTVQCELILHLQRKCYQNFEDAFIFTEKKEHLVFNIWVSYRLGHSLKLWFRWQPFHTSWSFSSLIEIVVCGPFFFSLTFASGWYSIQEKSRASEIPRMTTKFKARQNSIVLWGSLEQWSQFYCFSTLLHLS